VIITIAGADYQTPTVTEVDTFDRLHVEAGAGVTAVELGRSPALAAVGQLDTDGQHVWLDPARLKELAAPDGDAEWAAGFDAMVSYATAKGWTDDHGRLRAHVEWS
jgi:hypothetical protein